MKLQCPVLAEEVKNELETSRPRNGGGGLAELLEEALPKALAKLDVDENQALPSNAKLAEALGVSHITLRKALKGLESRGILRQLHGKGTFLRRRLSNDGRLSGTVVAQLPHVNRGYAVLFDALGSVLTKAGLKIRLETVAWNKTSNDSDWSTPSEIDAGEALGVIRSPSIYPPALIQELEFHRKLETSSVSTLIIDRPLTLEGISSVGFDDIGAIEQIFDKAMDAGFRSFHFVYPEVANVNMRNAERAEGFRRAAKKHKIDIEGRFIAADMLNSDTSSALLESALNRSERKTAFICGNDAVAAKLEQELSKLKKSGKEILVTGYDRYESTDDAGYDFPTAYRSRRLLGETAGKLMVKLLNSRLQAERMYENILLDPEIRF